MRVKLAGVCLIAAALALATSVPAQDGTLTTITDIRQESDEQSTRLIVQCTGPLAYTYYSPDALTLVVDIPEVDASQVPARIDVGTREVESLRITSLARADGRSLARLEVRLASLVPYQIFSKDRDLTLVFERSAAATAPPAPEPRPEPEPAAPAPATPVVASVPEPAPPSAAPAPAEVSAPAEIPDGPRATRIVAVAQEEGSGDLPSFTIKADGRLKYQDFTLPGPDRVVVDFADVTASPAFRSMDVDQGPVSRVRLGQFSAASPKVARLVVDLTEKTPYRIVEGADTIRILFGEEGEPQPPAHAPMAALRSPEPAEPAEPLPMVAEAAPRPIALEPLALPPLQEPQMPADEVPPDMPPMPEDDAIGTACGVTGNLGTPISLDFKDGDLQDIFRLFADISGLNVVVNPGVSGKVTLVLNEVPWGRALELILKTNALGCVLEGNVIRIASLSELEREEEDRRKLAEAKALAGELADYTKRISYAKATTLGGVLRQAGALSQRGQLNIDERTNTIIIRDLPSFIDKARALIAELDTATPQVEIEARIVVTSRNFTRDLGIQWGFSKENSTRYGNTTNQSWPNQIILNGSGVPSTLGLPADNLGPGGLSSDAGIGTIGRGYAVNLPANGFNSALGISTGNILGSFNLDLALTALERQGRGRLLSTPKVTTQNNQAAEIKQGLQIPIQTVANNTVTVQFKDAVLTLRVTPQITDAGTVILQLEVENNSADFANLVNGIPPINTQSARTIVQVTDGQTAVVGGIYQSTENTTVNQTPFLSKIPLLGYLFKNKAVSSQNNELLLFITPRIVKS
ncbi:MAG: type IV pilus secretin PilQ [Acidobacteria bacterium]|jgi:type IV pilus assembly protein PilQ|nr:type IV pilus secretin PilQ [Acidobacteriota bacterium]